MRPREFRRLRVGGVVLTIIGAALAIVPTQARADSDVSLSGLTKFAHLKVDGSHVFLTSGSGTTNMLVTNYSGVTVANITNESGADGMH